MTKDELEAEVARLRAALRDFGVDPDHSHHRQQGKQPHKGQAHSLVESYDAAALASRDVRYRAVFQSAVDFAIIVTDPEGVVTDWNPGAKQVLGWTAAEMRGRNAERIFTPEDRAIGRIEHEMQRALQEGRATDERWHLRNDGQRFWASGEMMPLLDERGEHLGFVKILRDRTKEHLAGIALQKVQERFQTIFDTVEAAFAIVEVKFDAEDQPINYRFVEANPAFERQSGVDLRGKWVTEYAPDLEPFWFKIYGHVAKTGEPTNFESYAEAFQRWFDVRAVRVGDPQDRQIAIIFNDVTNRREAEERLRVSEAVARQNVERVQLALEAGAIIGTWHWDIPSDQFTIDDGFARAFGLDPALGRSGIPLAQIIATVHPDDQAGLAKAMGDAISEGGRYAHQYRVRRQDGRYYWIEASGRVDLESDGTPSSFPGVLIDVEERRAIEAERDRATAELRSLNDTLEQRVAERTAELMQAEEKLRQSQKMEAVGQLTGGMAHDFNNLLQAMSGCLQLVGRRAGHVAGVQKVLDSGHQAVDRGASMIRQLMAFSRRQSLEPEAFDVRDRLLGMRSFLDRALRADIGLEFDLESGLWPAMADPVQFELAILNLATNARDAIAGAGRLMIGASNGEQCGESGLQGHFVRIWVRDSGHGMAPAMLERIFEPFFTTKPVGQGTGLGLAQVYGFCRQSGGIATVDSVEGQGTTVTLLLPRAEAMPAATVDAQRAMVDGGDASVLLVEDDPVVALVIVAALEEMGYRVSRAANGEEALRLLRDGETPDLLFTDVVMPGEIDGAALAAAARALLPGLAVVLTTGYSEDRAGLRGFPVLSKPYRIEDLALTLRKELDRSARNRSSHMEKEQ